MATSTVPSGSFAISDDREGQRATGPFGREGDVELEEDSRP
jgi:hypothetical protein